MSTKGEVTQEDIDYSYDLIKHVCTEIGPGCPCSPQEKERGEYLKKELEKVTDEVKSEEFTCAPNAFLGWFKFAGVLVVIGVIFYNLSLEAVYSFVFSFISTLIATTIILIFFFEFIIYKEFIDFLYKKKKSSNIVGTIRAKGPVKNIIIFSGHHDSALQYTWLRYLKFGYYVAIATMFATFLVLLVSTLIRMTQLIVDPSLGSVASTLPAFWWFLSPATFTVGFFFVERGKNGGKVPGAVDNLSAVASSWALGRILKRHPELVPNNTEIRIISFGCEEAGCRGSYRYVQRHRYELKKFDAACINFETICDPTIWIFKSDRNDTVKCSKEFMEEVSKAAEKSGVPFKVKPFPFGGGGTDAMRFAEAGIKTVSFFSLKIPEHMIKFYHQEFDNYDMVNKETLGNAMKIAVEFLRNRAA